MPASPTPTAERVAEIRAAVGNMGARRASKQGDLSSAMCRLSLPMSRDLLAALDAATAELVNERAAIGRLSKMVSDDESEAAAFKDAVDEHLPAYYYDLPNPDDCTEANEIERIEYAGADIRKLTRERDAARAALAECERQRDEWERAARKVAVDSLRKMVGAPAPLAWTASPPTSPGWWWLRDDVSPCRIVEVVRRRPHLSVIDSDGEWRLDKGLHPSMGWSSSPLPPPAEPVDAEPKKETT